MAYRSCVHSYMIHDSETWPVEKENKLTFQRAEMRIIRWMCNVEVIDSCELKESTETDDYTVSGKRRHSTFASNFIKY